MINNKFISRRGFMKNTAAITSSLGSGILSTSFSSGKNQTDTKSQSRKIKIAAVQMNALRENLQHNLEVHRRIAKEAAKNGCNLVMFPELSASAHYGHKSATSLAEEAAKGTIYETMHGLAKDLNVLISYGFCEIAYGTNYNSHAIIGPEGIIGIHRKVHASRDEYTYFRMGRSLDVFDLGFCKLGILICYDANFFEAWRVLALKGAEIILLPHASRSGVGKKIPREQQMKGLQKTLDNLPNKFGVYASDNNVFAVFANQVDYNGHSTHGGGAYIIGPDGNILSKSKPVLDDCWISTEIDFKIRDERRRGLNSTLKYSRPEVYSELTKMI